uniref:Gag protein n=1 Tax=Haemonchus placei TaxID=6290 RepID=A0A0N4W5I0_HAEPC
LKCVQFDSAQNEIVEIGSNVEVVESDGISTDTTDMGNNEARPKPQTVRRTQKTIRKTKISKRPHASQIKNTPTNIKSPNPSNPSTSNRSHDRMATSNRSHDRVST